MLDHFADTMIIALAISVAGCLAPNHHILELAIPLLVAWALALCAMPLASKPVGHVLGATGIAFAAMSIFSDALAAAAMRSLAPIAGPLGISLLLLRRGIRRKRPQKNPADVTLFVGDSSSVADITSGSDPIGERITSALSVASISDAETAYSEAARVTRRAADLGAVTVAVVGSLASHQFFLQQLAWNLEGTSSELLINSAVPESASSRCSLISESGNSWIRIPISRFSAGSRALKRALDITLSLPALLVLGIMFPIVALAIKADSPGPILYRQLRVGQDGKLFRILKFRSMKVDADAALSALRASNQAAGPLFKMHNDPRVTRIGRLLRRYSIDELPQFWNVLRGDMSIVGPRPCLREEAVTYEPHSFRRFFVPPGITGPWQVSGRSDLAWDVAVRLDLSYVENYSITTDLALIARTVGVLLRPKGAY
jgi:exopolysaccharide biosynthesis polyprenyl glycosylphosphotransferase